MANGRELKEISMRRLKSARYLLKSKDWEGSVYIMGYVLECALKSTICKTLDFVKYPDDTNNKTLEKVFKTHDFDILLTISGLNKKFSANGKLEEYSNWSDFTKEYPGNWPEMRYTLDRFSETLAKQLYTNLTTKDFGIISVIKKCKKW